MSDLQPYTDRVLIAMLALEHAIAHFPAPRAIHDQAITRALALHAELNRRGVQTSKLYDRLDDIYTQN